MNTTSLNVLLFGVLALLGIGLYGLMVSRNLIKVVVALQILVKPVLLVFVIAGNVTGKINLAQSLAINVIVADTIVAVVGMALAIQIRRHMGTLDVRELSQLRG